MAGRVWQDWPVGLPSRWPAGTVVTAGVFDGFHRGHQALVERARDHGRRLGLPVVLVTFEPHPLVVLAPERAPRQLLGIDDRVELAWSLGVDEVVVLPFTRELAALPAADFVADGLVGRLGMRALVVGDNFRCGRGGEGDTGFLRRQGALLGFDVDALGLVVQGARACSSTEVRRLLAAGDAAGAQEVLGRVDPRITGAALVS